jgi:LysR family carnitine catabolism transcriptional activator
VADLVGRFRRAHPAVSVRLAAPLDVDEVADAVRTGVAEVGVTEEGVANHGLTEERLGVQELLAVSPAGGPTTPLRLERLSGVPLVLSPPGSSLRDVVSLALASVGVEPQIAVEAAQRDALIPLVLAGAGTTFLPDALARAAERLGATVRPTRPRLRRTIVLVHRAGDPGPAAVRFLELATA